MSKKLKYKIISCSSQQSQFPSSQLLFGGQNGGWQTKRFCTYPQQVTFEFYGPVKVDKIQITSDNRKIPSQVDILFYMPFHTNGRQSQQKFQKYGYLNFNKNQNSQLKQHKSIMVDIKCLYLRFLFHKPHNSRQNFFSQIGIQQISVYGNDTNSTFAPIDKLPRQLGQSGGDNYGDFIEGDPFVVQKLALLNSQKQRAVEGQDFQTANEYKMIIDTVKKAGQQLKKLNYQKKKAIQEQDYQKANNIKKSIQKHRKQLDQLISQGYEQNDNITEQNEFVDQNNQQVLNDFQDNEFVDPQMNQMISKSGAFSSKGQNSRIIGGNSRIKINKTIFKKQNDKQKQNYDERVIPTLANNKVKTQESQLLQKQQEKKTELKLQDIDGKFIQYSIIMQEHFEQDTVKRFFSQHWQHKVQALGTILAETKKKQNPDASFIKCLIIVVKNSISETNFQVSLNSMQLFGDMLRTNAKGNSLGRSNQVANDLDMISRQLIRKITDNNNKIKQQAERGVTEMINSSLYGPEICTIALTKSKEKVKLSSKQLLSRLIEVQKIVEKNGNNQQIMLMASDFGFQNAKNPASEVRNQALNLLMICKEKDSSKLVEKKISQKNLSQVIEAHQNKAGSKSIEKTSKVKKTK